MKKTLLLFCVFANMVNAQILPDSIYTYNGSNKILYSGAAISYDESGRKILEKGMINSNGDGILNEEDREYKIEYTYTETDNMLKKEETESYFENEKWKDYIKTVQVYNISNLNVPVERYDYTVYNNDWLLYARTSGTEYNEKGLPVVLMDTLFDVSPLIFGYGDVVEVDEIKRLEVAYNEAGMPEFTIELMSLGESGNEVLIPFRKRESTYNDNSKLMKEVYYYRVDENWTYAYEYVYAYDENGNAISMIRLDDIQNNETYYKNVYIEGGSSNDVFFSVQSDIYPNPVSEVLYVTLEGADNAVITLVNMAGSVVVQQKTSHPSTSIPVQSFAKGFYFLTVKTDKGIKTHKVIIR